MDCIPAARSYLFLAEGVFPYFPEEEVRRVFIALAERFPGSELVVDALSPFMVHSSAFVPSFRGYQARPCWGVSDPMAIERWCSSMKVLDIYNYFDQTEPRLAGVRWMAKLPVFRAIARVLHLRLGTSC
jgi:O-methyltransferase involved in polyketide biosynthesis